MKFGISFKPQNPKSHAQLWALAEKKGFSYAWLADNINRRDAFATLAICAEHTDTIKIGPGVAGLAQRHPALIASGIATINEISEGRAVLGLGLGGTSVETFNLTRPNLKECEKLIERIKQELTGAEGRPNEGVIREWYPSATVPIYWGGTGAKSLEFGGKVADGVLAMGGVTPELVEYTREHVKKGSETSGRKIEDIDLCIVTTSSISSDGEAARKEVAPHGAGIAYHCYVSKGFPYPERLLPYAKALAATYTSETAANRARVSEAYNHFTEDMIDTFCLAGTPSHIVRKVEQLSGSGIDHIMVSMGSVLDKSRGISEFGDEVISVFS